MCSRIIIMLVNGVQLTTITAWRQQQRRDDDPGWWWGDNYDDEYDDVDDVLALNIIFLPTVLFNPYKR